MGMMFLILFFDFSKFDLRKLFDKVLGYILDMIL